MKRNNQFWWFVAVSITFTLAVICSLAILLWQQLTPAEKAFFFDFARNHMGYIFSVLVLLLAGAGFALDWVFRVYVLPLNKLAEETRIIHAVNPSHRIRLEGSADIVKLAEIINEGAERFESLHNEIQNSIHQARSDAEEEKNILAAIMAELPEGVLICNKDGQIILYNKRAKQFFTEDSHTDASSDSAESGKYVGLGRSVFSIIDKNIIVHALDEIASKLQRDESDVASYFVVVGSSDRLLRVEAVPVLDPQREYTGFILIFYDITQQIEKDTRVDVLLRNVIRKTRACLASIRATIEAIRDYPDMASTQRDQFRDIIHQEAVNMGQLIDHTAAEYSTRFHSRWPLTRMHSRDLMAAVVKKGVERLNFQSQNTLKTADCWIQVDSYSIVMAILFIQSQLQKVVGNIPINCELNHNSQFVMFDLLWKGKPVRMDTIRSWYETLITVENETLPLTLQEVITHHHAEIWSYAHDEPEISYLRLLLPLVEFEPKQTIRDLTILPKSRPEFFDFDLFNQPGQNPEMDNLTLMDLAYTVFDTETTGLDPKGGDEIISIGAVRIVNGRLLRGETFDQLVNPMRSLPWKSIQIHGIQPELLEDQPTIDTVLPQFSHYADNTILVAHNAAFDMRMLQIKEEVSGVRFTNPVLDTMLLSAVVHPGQKDHNIEGMADRLGVRVVGRHTALGDAIVTAELFLKLIPLLKTQGIVTLKEARAASQKTYYSRLKY